MINERDRDLLVDYRIKQATDNIEHAKFLIISDRLLIAVNRIYYGMYYALTALALKNRFETSKHGQLIGWFNKEFVSNKKVDPKYGRILRNAFKNRTKSDYDAFISFERAEVNDMLTEMVDFIEEIKRLVYSK